MERLTPKQERFAQAFASGDYESASAVYREVYDADGSKPETVWKRACELLANGKVKGRVTELRREAAARAGVTLESHLTELARLKEKALDAGQTSAAVVAETNRGKVSGLYVERHENVGPERQLTESDLISLLSQAVKARPDLLGSLVEACGFDPQHLVPLAATSSGNGLTH